MLRKLNNKVQLRKAIMVLFKRQILTKVHCFPSHKSGRMLKITKKEEREKSKH